MINASFSASNHEPKGQSLAGARQSSMRAVSTHVLLLVPSAAVHVLDLRIEPRPDRLHNHHDEQSHALMFIFLFSSRYRH